MKRKDMTRKSNKTQRTLRWWSGLQARMTFSYIWITAASSLLLSIPVMVVELSYFFPALQKSELQFVSVAVKQTASQEASKLSSQMNGVQPGQKVTLRLDTSDSASLYGDIGNGSLVVPYIARRYPDTQPVAFELFIMPDEKVAVSSYPGRYTINASIIRLIPYAASSIRSALSGKSGKAIMYTTRTGGSVIGVAQPVRSRNRILGVLYVEYPYLQPFKLSLPLVLIYIGLILLLLCISTVFFTAPIAAIFGFITTRGLVRRVRRLINATELFADGNYEQRVAVTRKDEIGQLEHQFNRMAEQLVESIKQRQMLAEQNAQLAERSRISRELHDAVSQELFSLSMLAGGLQTALPQDSPAQSQIAMLGKTTSNMIREMRALLLELRPTQLEDLGLAESLKELAASYRTRVGINVTTMIHAANLSARIEHALLRISQEALANAVRHANASRIDLSLIPVEKEVILTIKDNGKGFNTSESVPQHGLGLRLMQERVQELHGTMALQSAPDQGTCLQVRLPIATGVLM